MSLPDQGGEAHTDEALEPSTPPPHVPPTTPPPFTDEQKKRIAASRRAACSRKRRRQEAAVHGDRDGLASPSAAIVLGKPPKCGTGAFELKGRLFQGGEEAE